MATNITYHPTPLTPSQRTLLRQNQSGLTIWLTGLSASGKSTIAVALEETLLSPPYSLHAYRLDGDNIRLGLNRDLGFSPRDRSENIRRVAETARLFADSCSVAITSFISPYRADRHLARALHEMPREAGGAVVAAAAAAAGDGDGQGGIPFVEVFVDVSVEEAERRDPKGLYRLAREGKIKEFTGVSAPYEVPLRPEVHIRGEETGVREAVEQILGYLEGRGLVRKRDG